MKSIPCPGCAKPLTMSGCLTRGCMFGPSSGYTLPPPPKMSEYPDPFSDKPVRCPMCDQPLPKDPA